MVTPCANKLDGSETGDLEIGIYITNKAYRGNCLWEML